MGLGSYKPGCGSCGGGSTGGDVNVEVSTPKFRDKCYLVDDIPTLFCCVEEYDAESNTFTNIGAFVDVGGVLTPYTGDLSLLQQCTSETGDVTVNVDVPQTKFTDICYLVDDVPTQFCVANKWDSTANSFVLGGYFTTVDGVLTPYAGDITALVACPEDTVDQFVTDFEDLCVIENGVNTGEVRVMTVYSLDGQIISTSYFTIDTGIPVPYTGDVALIGTCLCDEDESSPEFDKLCQIADTLTEILGDPDDPYPCPTGGEG